jgi:cell shape-determining protein MreD
VQVKDYPAGALIAIAILAVVAVIDLWLEFTKRKTISEWYQAQFPTSADIVFMLAVVLTVMKLNLNPDLKVILGVLAGHVFWANRERHK